MLQSDLCDYSAVCIAVKGSITVQREKIIEALMDILEI